MVKPEHPEIVFASANVADPRYRPLFMVRPATVGRFATAAGFKGGVEWHPAFDIFMASPGAVARAVKRGDLNLYSLHMAFRETRRSRDTNSTPETRPDPSLMDRVVAGPLGRLIMPEVANSSKFMGEVQRRVGERACVMYPLLNPAHDKCARAMAGPGLKLIQVTDRVAAMYEARTPEELIEKTIHTGGYDGFIADTIHAHPDRYDGAYPRVVSDLDRSLPVLQDYIYGAHPAFGRVDIAANNGKLRAETEADLNRARRGIYVGVTGQIMRAAWGAPNFRYAALETTAKSLGASINDNTYDGLRQGYNDLAQGLYGYDPNAGPG